MSATLNGKPMWDGRPDSAASRCCELIERGLRKFGISQSTPLVRPTKARDMVWQTRRSRELAERRGGRLLTSYPCVLGMPLREVAEKFNITRTVAGRLLRMQARNKALAEAGAAGGGGQ